MNPYYEDEQTTIYNGDCREILQAIPDDSVDIVLSSPPYNQIAATAASGMMKEFNHKQLSAYDGYNDDMEEEEYQNWQRAVFSEARGKCRGLCWINHKTRFRNKQGIHPLQIYPWPFYSEVVWDRKVSITLNARKFAPSHEYLYAFGEPHWWDDSQNIFLTVWQIMPEREIKGHPCPFPLSIARRVISASCPPGGIAIDPFMGSGTTLLAAKLEGRRAIGIEKNREYCDIAVERLRQRVLF